MEDLPENNILPNIDDIGLPIGLPICSPSPKWLINKKKYDLQYIKNKYKNDAKYREKQIEKKSEEYRERKQREYIEKHGSLEGFTIRPHKRRQQNPVPI